MHTERVAMGEERGLSAQLVEGDSESLEETGRSCKDEEGMSAQAMKEEPDRRRQVMQ